MPEHGVCPRQEILQMIEAGLLHVGSSFDDRQLQPASLDIALRGRIVCTSTSFIPQPEEDIGRTLEKFSNYWFEMGPDHAVLMAGQTYIGELNLVSSLPDGFRGSFNPKSTTGRADMFTRVLADGEPRFDILTHGKRKQTYLEMAPLSGNLLVAAGLPLTQLRVEFGKSELDEASLRLAYAAQPLLHDYDGNPIPLCKANFRNGGLEMTVDLQSEVVAYRRKKTCLKYDIGAPKGGLTQHKDEFWEAIPKPESGELILQPDEFYLLSTRERVRFPPTLCGTLEAYDVSSAEGRVHYAGFFDPGFGFGNEGELPAAAATLEVRVHHRPFRIVDGQSICVMRFNQMRQAPVDQDGHLCVYGTGSYAGSSNYQGQRGPRLPKQFL